MRPRIGRFDIVRHLGEGGMGAVYLARDAELDQLVALKVAGHEGAPGNALVLRRLRREFRLMQRLRHEHIVDVYELFDEGGMQFFSMEFVDGGNLHRYLGVAEGVSWGLPSERSTEGGRLPKRPPARRKTGEPPVRPLEWEEDSTASFPRVRGDESGPRGSLSPTSPPTAESVVEVVRQLLAALRFIHDHGVVHRDLKPSNILMTAQGKLKLMDFGVARPAEFEENTSVGLVVGTYAYMSPEQAGGKEVDGRCDLYAVGVLVYELLTGRPPFVGSTPMELMWKHVHEPPPDPLRVRPEADRELAAIAMRCLEKDPRNRYADARSVERALESRSVRKPRRSAVTDERPSLFYAPSVAGRVGEMTALKGHLREAMAGRGSWVLVSGESGIGKSRLVSEVGGYARLGGVRLLRGQCVAGGAPYEGFRGVFDGIVERYRPTIAQGLPAGVQRSATALAHLFQSVRALGVGQDFMAGGALPPAEERQRVMSAARELIFSAAEDSPSLVVIEDLHLGDEVTVVLCGALAASLRELATRGGGPRLLLVTTHRDDEVEAPGAHPLRRIEERLVADGVAHRIRLGPLSRPEVAELVTSMVGPTATEAVVDRLHAESGGNPYFLEELVKTWRDEPTARAPVPSTLSAAVARRAAVLSARAREVVETAAVLAREFEMDVLINATQLPEVEVLDAVEELVQRRLLSEDQQYGRELLRFRQEITRQSIVESLPLARRRTLHLAAAHALESLTEGPSEIVGQHYLAGGEPAVALRYLERAASGCAASYANDDALRLYDLALAAHRELVGPARERFRLLMARAAVLDHMGRRDDERRTVEEAERLARQSGDAGLLSDAFVRWAEHYNVTAEGDAAEEMATRALELSRERSDRFREARALRELARSFATRGDDERCFDLLEELLRSAQELGDLPMEAAALGTMGVCQMALGDFVVARRRLLDAADRWRRIGDRRSLASTLVSVALVDEGTGRFGEALRLLTEVLRIRHEIGHRHGEAQAGAALVNTRRLLGDLDGARRESDAALILASEVESKQIASLAHLYRALTELDAEDDRALPVVVEHATAAAAEAREVGDPGLEARSLAVLAEAARRRGDLPEAEELSGLALDRLSVRGYASFGGEEEVLYVRSRVLEDAGRINAAADALAKAYSRVQTKSERIEDQELRRRFLHAVPLHRAIVAAWEGRRRSALPDPPGE